jgi:cobalamin synthase
MISFLMRFHSNRHLVGLFLLLFSLIPFLFTNPYRGLLLLCYVLFCFGVIFVSDYGAQKLTGSSYLTKILNNGTRRNHFILISIIAGIILEAVAAYFGHLWRYPYFSPTVYVLVAIFLKGFAWYLRLLNKSVGAKIQMSLLIQAFLFVFH